MPDLVDVVVVGGGVLGAALTWGLARRNLRVLLLEAERLGSGATGSGFAWVNATAKANEDETYFRLNAQGLAHYDRLVSEWGAERLGVHGGGSLFWTRPDDAEGQKRLRRDAQRLRDWNYPVALLNRNELAVLEPSIAPAPANANAEDNAALFAPADKWIDTPRLCRFFIEQAQRHKAEIRLNCPAVGFTRTAENAISTVETPRGRVATHLLVLAAGIHTPRLVTQVTGDPALTTGIPVRQVPGLLVEIAPLASGQPCRRIVYPPDANGLHLRPTPNGGLLIGADDTDAWLHRSHQDAAAAKSGAYALPDTLWHPLLERAARCFPNISLAELKANATPRLCVRPVPADGFPVVGALPDVPGAYVAVTHSGITLGPLLADLLANEIFTHTPSPLLAPYRPERKFTTSIF